MNRAATVRKMWIARTIESAPLFVVFGYPVILPVAALLTTAGIVAALVIPLAQDRSEALNFIRPATDAQQVYYRELHLLQEECYSQRSQGDVCDVSQSSAAAASIETMRRTAQAQGLTDCQPQTLHSAFPFNDDYLVCSGSKHADAMLSFGWVFLGFVLIFLLVYLYLTSVSHRALLPKCGLKLWYFPYALGAILLGLIPLGASLSVFDARLQSYPIAWPAIQYLGLSTIALSAIAASWWAIDFRTCFADRLYWRGVGFLLLESCLAYVVILLAFAAATNHYSWGYLLVAVVVFVGCGWVTRQLWRSPSRPGSSRALRKFCGRMLLMIWPSLLALLVVNLPASALIDLKISTGQAAFCLLLVNMAWSRIAESRAIS